MADFIQRHVLHTTTQIALYGLGQSRHDGAAQERAVAGKRIGDFDADLLDLILVVGEVLVVFVTHERVAQRLDHAVFRKLVGNLALT